MNLSYFSQIVQSKYYFGGGKYEIETSGTETQRLYLDGSPYTASILLEKIGSASLQTYYLHRDYLGSITHISDNSGNLAAEYSYDAWGRMRNPLNWDVYAQGSQPAMPHGERGYTGHEQLNQFGLINMNARLYDPLLARFLAPDPQVGNPETSNGFNRYMYASDNPMMFVDLNGEDGDHPYDGYTGGSWNGSGGSGSGQNSSGYNQNTGSSNSSGGFYSPGSGYTGGAYPDLSGGFGGYSAGNSDSGLGGFIIGVFESLYNLFSGGGSRHSSPPHPVMKLSSHPIIKTHGAFPASIGSSGGGNRRGNSGNGINSEPLIATMTYSASMVNNYRSHGKLILYDGNGNVITDYSATSGSGSGKVARTLPAGEYYAYGYLKITDDHRYMYDNVGFKINLGPDKVWDSFLNRFREGLRIHPAKLGTLGCIGLNELSPILLDFQSRWLNTIRVNKRIPVNVVYY